MQKNFEVIKSKRVTRDNKINSPFILSHEYNLWENYFLLSSESEVQYQWI